MADFFEKLLLSKEQVENLVPFDNEIVVRIDYPEEKTSGGIVLTGATVDKEIAGRIFGKVLKVGNKCSWAEQDIDVVFAKYSGVCVYKTPSDSKERYEVRIMPETALIGKIDGAIK